MTYPLISKKIFKKSKWFSLAEKSIMFKGKKVEKYHSIIIHDYVVVIAKTISGKIPLVRQYRPAIEKKTWEFPAGLVDERISSKNIAIKELKEEARLDTIKIKKLGSTYADPGRLNCKVHMYFAECSDPNLDYKCEDNLSVKFVSKLELMKMILKNEIFAMHVSLIYFGKIKKIKWFEEF